MSMLSPKKILVMKFRNIGDVLLVSTLIKNLKLHYPEASIDIALNKGTEEMILGHPSINEVLIYDRQYVKKMTFLNRIKSEIIFALNIRDNKYDIVINTTEGDRGAQLTKFSGAKIKIGYQPKKNYFLKNTFNLILPKQAFRHTIETNLDVLRVLNLDIKEKQIEIFWSSDDEVTVPNIFVHIHPVSRWLFKCISDTTMASIIDYIENDLQIKVVLTAAPVQEELDKMETILGLCDSTPINMAGKLTLKQTAALNKKAKIFVGVDTAIMHISAANDIPVLAFFGPSGADHWGPWDNSLMDSEYIMRRGFRSMGKHRVIQENWECVPCGKDGCEGTKISDCLMHLDLEFIFQNIDNMLSVK